MTSQSNPILETIRCVIYTRVDVSLVPDQIAYERMSQETLCRDYLTTIPHELIGVFHDQAGAAFEDGRPALQQALALAAQGKMDQLVVYNLFRISETPYEIMSFANYLRLCRTKLVCVFDLDGYSRIKPQ